MQVTYLQKYTYEVANMGYNIFLTGDAGTGKSFIINKYIKDKEKQGYNVMKLASTGIAASNINGVTIHKEFKLPTGVLSNKLASYDDIDECLIESDIIVIDEISMCRVDLFDFVANKILRANSIRKNRGYKILQFIVVGDFFQLPPVITEYDKNALDKIYGHDIGSGFAFQSKFWNMFEFKNIILTEVIRQSNREFLTQLNKLRIGDKSSLDYFYNNSNKNEIEGAITICSKNSEVAEINNRELNKISGDAVEYRAILNGDVNYNDTVAEFNLVLKPNARIMMLVNQSSYNNGTFGFVKELNKDYIMVQLDSGIIEKIERYTWEIYKYDIIDETESTENKKKLTKRVVGTLEQFPVKLAYAITIHKSQGQTYDYVNLSPYCWDCGQLYTALSRVKSLSNMYIKYDIDTRYAVIALSVVKFHNEMVKTANQTVQPMQNEENNTKHKDKDIQNDMDTIQNLLRDLK